MTAITLRNQRGTSGLQRQLGNRGRSYGLLQINLLDPNVSALIKSKIPEVAADEKALLDQRQTRRLVTCCGAMPTPI